MQEQCTSCCPLIRMSSFCEADTEVPAALAALLLAPSSSELQSAPTLPRITATRKPCSMA